MPLETPIDFQALDLGPDLAELGPNLLVEFTANRLLKARVAWLNARWWLERGVDTGDGDVRAEVERWLLSEYAYCVPADGIRHHLADTSKTFYADRYGASGGTTQGGSGRCGVSGRLNVKGIGRTPLVGASDVVDHLHSHGCMWLEEAVREAIHAEIAAAEFPHGAVPIVAIIDTGIHLPDDEDHPDRKGGIRALVVRPNFVRLAHLQRSVLFGSAGFPESDQYIDMLRTRDAVNALWGANNRREELKVVSTSLRESMDRFADQIAYYYLHRLFFGAISSSNLTADGEIVDFGASQALPDWTRVHVDAGVASLGNEWPAIQRLLGSLSFFQAKYLPAERVENVAAIGNAVVQTIFRKFSDHACTFLGAKSDADRAALQPVVAVLRDYYRQQQKARPRRLHGRRDWIYAAMRRSSFTADPKAGREARSALALKSAVRQYAADRSHAKAEEQAVWMAAERMMLPRPWLYWAPLTYRVRRLMKAHYDTAGFAERVDEFVNGVLSRSRRHWPEIPAYCAVVAQRCDTYSWQLHCYNFREKRYVDMVGGLQVGDGVHVLGQRIDRGEFDGRQRGYMVRQKPLPAAEVGLAREGAGPAFFRYAPSERLVMETALKGASHPAKAFA